MIGKKVYLGDSVYVEFDGFQFNLTTENGYEASNRIALEPEVFEKLSSYVETHKAAKQMPTVVEG
jgi:hypothetical protein